MASFNSNTKREEKGRNIQVVVRCRPFCAAERKVSLGVVDCDPIRKEVVVRTGGLNDKAMRKNYTFDMVFGPAAKQIDVYRSVVCPILDEVIMGYNCTVFAYGQTGTGKTFTMEGERSPGEQFTWEEDPLAGIIPRTLHQIFEKLSDNGTEFSIKVSLMEIYNEELFDLLSPSEDVTERLQLFDDPRNKRGVVVKGLEEVVVHNKDEVYQILERGSAKRKTASTLMNAYSSRSHSVFSVTIHMKEMTLDGEELVKIGKLNLVDLAGSENIGRSGAVDKRAREAGNINQSLLTLGRVITALVEKRPHVPYRESKLTRILQDSLGGRTKTSIIATVSPSSSNLEETLSTLEYASRAKNIMNKPEVNQKLTKRTLIKEYTEEIERLKRDLAATRDKNGVYLSSENYESLSNQLASQEEQVTEYLERISAMEEELKKVTELFEDSRGKLERVTTNLDLKEQRLEETSKDLMKTKEELVEEKFVSSQLTSTHKNLYNTAGQLLETAHASTQDVSDLHDKLERKSSVEQHNSGVQQSFAQRMDGAFGDMQSHIAQQSMQHLSMLSTYSQAADKALSMNQEALNRAQVAMETLVGGFKRVMAEGTARCHAKIGQQELWCRQNLDNRLQLLEERRLDVEEVLEAHLLLGLSAIQDLGSSLRSTTETQRTLVNKVDVMMKETRGVFSGLVRNIEDLRKTSEQGISALQAEHDQQEEEIRHAEEKHQAGVQHAIRCFQDQLKLLEVETKGSFQNLHQSSSTQKKSLGNIQLNITQRCNNMETQASSQTELLSSCSSLSASLQQNTQEGLDMLGELSDSSSHLHRTITGLAERDACWSSKATQQAETQAQELLALMGESSAAMQASQKSVESFGTQELHASSTELAQRQQQLSQTALEGQSRFSQDQSVLEQCRAALQSRVATGSELVHGFLQQELRQDVPTGATPQRREFTFPRFVERAKSREELLEGLRRQQEALMATMEEEEEETGLVEHDSLEDEQSTCNESLALEQSSIDENLICSENRRVPFFKQKKGSKRPLKSKGGESDSLTPQRSKLPLRTQN